jgi:hypothetical protein
MDPISAAETAIKIGGFLFQMIEKYTGTPEWAKYVEAGIGFAPKALALIKDIQLNPSRYDTMTPADIFTTLTPLSIEDIEAQAKAELGL